MGKVKNISQITQIAQGLRKKGKRIVFTNGCFDILHYGHIKYLEKCKRLGNVLVIGLNSDLSVTKIKGSYRPVTGQKERRAILSALAFVDYITVFSDPTPLRLIKKIKPDVLVKGGDWKEKDIVGGDYVKKLGGKVVSVPLVKGYSTTGILRRIKRAF